MSRHFVWTVSAIVLLLLGLAGTGSPALSMQVNTQTPTIPLTMVATAAMTPTVQVTATTEITSTATVTTTAEATLGATSGITVSPALLQFEQSLESIYTFVSPSVVNISVIGGQTFAPNQENSPFGPQQGPSEGSGSGFVWDATGNIVTNNHVVAGADSIAVTFSDGTTVPATVVGTDPDSDLAVVKVNLPADQLHPVTMTDSSQVKVGQLSIAIGNPFGLQGTMTVGFVSAVGRLLPTDAGATTTGSYSIPDVIQTDAPINPGNSGGVLVDDRGQVIGVTSALISTTRASAGIGFAIPSAIVQNVVPTLIQSGTVQHPWIGISGIDMTPDLAGAMGLSTTQRGVLIAEVTPASPADKAGLTGSDRTATINGEQAPVGGDIIVGIEGKPVRTFADLIAYLARSTQVGQSISLSILRGGQEQSVNVTLAARPAQPTAPARTTSEPGAAGGGWLGIAGIDLTTDIASAMTLPPTTRGILVQRVTRGSPADQAGLRGSFKPVTVGGVTIVVGGDVITAIDAQTLTGIVDLQTYLAKTRPGDKATLTVLRDGQSVDVPITLGERPASAIGTPTPAAPGTGTPAAGTATAPAGSATAATPAGTATAATPAATGAAPTPSGTPTAAATTAATGAATPTATGTP